MPRPRWSTTIDQAIPLDSSARKSVRRAAWRQWNRNPINGLIFGLALAIPIFMFPWVSKQLAPVQGWTGFPAFLLTFSIYGIYIFTLSACLKRWRFAPLMYAELRARGFDVCLKCGYWLRDLDSSITICPECGSTRPNQPTT